VAPLHFSQGFSSQQASPQDSKFCSLVAQNLSSKKSSPDLIVHTLPVTFEVNLAQPFDTVKKLQDALSVQHVSALQPSSQS